MTKFIFLLLTFIGSSLISVAQNEVTRNWTGFQQSIDASFLKNKVKFKVSFSLKMDAAIEPNQSGIWVRIENKGGSSRFVGFAPKDSDPIKTGEWATYTIEGTMDETSNALTIGGHCKNDGKFYFDNFELFVENDNGEFQKASLKNPDFELPFKGHLIPGWIEGTGLSSPVKVKGYTLSQNNDCVHGNCALLIEGKNTQMDTTYIIGPVKGFTPQMGTLVTMLNNMTARVEAQVRSIDQKNIDYMIDEKANSIGALVMHLAAAEAYYQVSTFENRGFNEEEKEKWQDALELGDKARKRFRGKEISYYLEQFRAVRKKTIEELRKRNDEWLMEVKPGSEINTYFQWFHMVEHQSSHLGQIRLIEKRLPKQSEKMEQKIDLE